MNEPFEIPVLFNGKELVFTARLVRFGYSHKIVVDVNGKEVFFEPDEEGNYRALQEPEESYGNRHANVPLLQAISEAIERILK
jgi:hypothetical protein